VLNYGACSWVVDKLARKKWHGCHVADITLMQRGMEFAQKIVICERLSLSTLADVAAFLHAAFMGKRCQFN
jgi:hypothetical protein